MSPLGIVCLTLASEIAIFLILKAVGFFSVVTIDENGEVVEEEGKTRETITYERGFILFVTYIWKQYLEKPNKRIFDLLEKGCSAYGKASGADSFNITDTQIIFDYGDDGKIVIQERESDS